MIGNLIEFGKWLDKSGQAHIGDTIPDSSLIMFFRIDNRISSITFNTIMKYDEYKKKMQNSQSQFERNLYVLTGNDSLTDTKGIGGISPFFFKLPNIILKNTKKEINKIKKEQRTDKENNKEEIEKKSSDFFKKIAQQELVKKIDLSKKNRRKKQNRNYILHIQHILTTQELIEKYSALRSDSPQNSILYKTITNYFELVEKDLKSDESVILRAFGENLDMLLTSKKGIYMYFKLEEDFLWINELFLDYVKYYKKQNDDIEFMKGFCPYCKREESTLVYKEFPFFALQKPNYNWNFEDNDLRGSKFRICSECNYFLQVGFDTLKDEFKSGYLLIPSPKADTDPQKYGDFLKEIRENSSKFEKINLALNSLSRYFSFAFAVYMLGDDRQIKRYIPNYKAFLLEFEDIKLYEDNKLRYLFGEKAESEKEKSIVKNMFDLEKIFKQFFIDIRDEKIVYPQYYFLYQIYTKDLTGKKGRNKGIFYDFNSKTVSIFARYMDNLFSLIYELDEDALSREMLNVIALNCLTTLEKHNKREKNALEGRFDEDMKKRLNYYFMLRKELLGDKMMDEKNIMKLKKICNRYSEQNEEKMSEEDTKKILELVKEEPAIKYYLIGQFVRLIENIKANEGKKADLFTSYISNSNRNNIRNIFATEILKKNNYYISRLNRKGKIIFDILEKEPNLFEEKSLKYEDYLLLMFTGYYTKNILTSTYGKEEKNAGGA